MSARVNAGLVDTGIVLVRGSGTNTFRAESETIRDTAFQAQVAPDRVWVKTLAVETSLDAPQITTLQAGLSNVVSHANSMQDGLNDVETHVSTLQTWREGLDPRGFGGLEREDTSV